MLDGFDIDHVLLHQLVQTKVHYPYFHRLLLLYGRNVIINSEKSSLSKIFPFSDIGLLLLPQRLILDISFNFRINLIINIQLHLIQVKRLINLIIFLRLNDILHHQVFESIPINFFSHIRWYVLSFQLKLFHSFFAEYKSVFIC